MSDVTSDGSSVAAQNTTVAALPMSALPSPPTDGLYRDGIDSPGTFGTGSKRSGVPDGGALQEWYDDYIGSGALAAFEQQMHESFSRTSNRSMLSTGQPGAGATGRVSQRSNNGDARSNSGTQAAPLPMTVDLYSKIQSLRSELQAQSAMSTRLNDANVKLISRVQELEFQAEGTHAVAKGSLEHSELISRSELLWAQGQAWMIIVRQWLLPESLSAHAPEAASPLAPTYVSDTITSPLAPMMSPRSRRRAGTLVQPVSPGFLVADSGTAEPLSAALQQQRGAKIAQLEAEKAELQTQVSKLETELELVRMQHARAAEPYVPQPQEPDEGQEKVIQELREALLRERLRYSDLAGRSSRLQEECGMLRGEAARQREKVLQAERREEESKVADLGAKIPSWVQREVSRQNTPRHRVEPVETRAVDKARQRVAERRRGTSAHGSERRFRRSVSARPMTRRGVD